MFTKLKSLSLKLTKTYTLSRSNQTLYFLVFKVERNNKNKIIFLQIDFFFEMK